MPRPDLVELNISHRRIPIVTIGKDVYYDTRLIIRKLEALFPSGALGASDLEYKALERLMERWTVDAGIFTRSSQLIPLDLPTMKDPNFIKDRESFTGRNWKREGMQKARGEAMVYLRDAFELLETTLLADGREWIFKTEKPSLGDIEGEITDY
jgi:glutathione S-transferase